MLCSAAGTGKVDRSWGLGMGEGGRQLRTVEYSLCEAALCTSVQFWSTIVQWGVQLQQQQQRGDAGGKLGQWRTLGGASTCPIPRIPGIAFSTTSKQAPTASMFPHCITGGIGFVGIMGLD